MHFVKIKKQRGKQFHHIKEKLWTFYFMLCVVLRTRGSVCTH